MTCILEMFTYYICLTVGLSLTAVELDQRLPMPPRANCSSIFYNTHRSSRFACS